MPNPDPTGITLPVLAKLLGSTPADITLLGGGGNSRVYRVTSRNGSIYALKAYFRDPEDKRDRLGVEFGGLGFLWDHGIRAIPKPVGADPENGLALLEFIPGDRVLQPSREDVTESCRFLVDLHHLSIQESASSLPLASEAHFSLAAVAENVQARLDRLGNLDATLLERSGLGSFLEDELLPAWRALHADCLEGSHRWAISFDEDIPLSDRTLSPSDFGFHNALRRHDRLVFIDFEYFGWDDPAKQLADFLLHPGMDLAPELRKHFAETLLEQLLVPGLRQRARVAYPLFGIKWCAIILNEFLQGPLHRRRFAAPSPLAPEERQTRQLLKCRQKLQQVLNENDNFTLFHVPH